MLKKFVFFILLFSACYSIDYSHWSSAESNLSIAGHNNSSPQIVIHPVTGKALCVWANGTTNNIQIASSLDGGTIWLPASEIVSDNIAKLSKTPKIAINPLSDSAICVWGAEYPGTGPFFTQFIQKAFSFNLGETWTIASGANVREGAYYQTAINPQTNNCVYGYFEPSGFPPEIQVQYSTDNGVSYAALPSGILGTDVQLVTNNALVLILAYVDTSGTAIDSAYSNNGGTGWTFAPPIPIYPAGMQVANPSLAINVTTQDAVCVLSEYNGNNWVIRSAYTNNPTNPWNVSATPPPSPAAEDAKYPKVAVDSSSGRVICVWQNLTSGRIQAAYSVDNGNTFVAASNDLSPTGNISESAQLTINPTTGDAICVWRNKTTTTIQSAYSSDGGITWIRSPNDLSDKNAYDPQIAVNPTTGKVACVWSRYNGSTYDIQATYSPVIPYVSIRQETKKLLFQDDIVNVLSWDAVAQASYYRVYSDSNLSNMIYQGMDLFFADQGRKANTTYTYYVTWTNATGIESAPTIVSVP